MDLKFDEKGLIPAIVQDHYTKEVLTLAYMNAETLALTIAEGRTGAAAVRRSGARARPAATSSVWCPSPPTVTPTRWWWRSSRAALPATPVPRAAFSTKCMFPRS